MRRTTLVFAASLFAGAVTAGAVGCGSSKTTGGPPGVDASTLDSGGDGAGGSGSSCSPLGGGMCNPGQGLTCCVDLLAAISDPTDLGTCVVESACASTIQYACASPSQCASGQSCCGGIGIEAGLLAAFADGGDAGFGAEDDSGGGVGAAGLPAALNGITLESFCQASCMASQIVLCGSDSDCPSGLVCGSPVAAFGGGASGAAGGLLSAFGAADAGPGLMTCQSPDAGIALPVDSGVTASDAALSVDAGSANDAASSADAGAPREAGSASDTGSAADAEVIPGEAGDGG